MASDSDANASPSDDSGSRPVYSIGAVARMVDVDPSTLRSWEDRYGLVVPARTEGSQRLYSRDEVARLRFIMGHLRSGVSAGDAHRLLAQHLDVPPDLGSGGEQPTVIVILLAERDRYAAELCEFFLRTEGYDVCLALEPAAAERLYVERRPNLSIVELMISGGGLALVARLARDADIPVLAVSALALRDRGTRCRCECISRQAVRASAVRFDGS